MLLFINCDVVNGNHAFKGFDLGDCFLQRSRQQGNQLGLVDALVDGVAVRIYFILFASDGFGNNSLGFVSEETDRRVVSGSAMKLKRRT
jgi:hypothetical protein